MKISNLFSAWTREGQSKFVYQTHHGAKEREQD